jgi:hypothetical protein
MTVSQRPNYQRKEHLTAQENHTLKHDRLDELQGLFAQPCIYTKQKEA